MPKLVLGMLQRILQIPMKNQIEHSTSFTVTAIENNEIIPDFCEEENVNVVLLEVRHQPPWDIERCLLLQSEIREKSPSTKTVFLCDSKNGNLGKQVMLAKREKLIDDFLYADTGYDYLCATLESLVVD
ncbi:MAG: hypothetical protein GXZ11_06255 [Tissierellia bacterium]|nr:hypothetical protein [Tissierellia bacterium]